MIPGVPYDAEIEYLQSTGGQHIDLSEWLAGKSVTVEIKWCPLSTTNDRFIFGGGQHSTPANARLGVYGSGNNFTLPNGSVVHIYNGNGNPTPFKNIVKVDKEYIISGSNLSVSSSYMYLFCQEWNSTTNGKIAAKLFYAKFFVNGNLYSDLIPVRIGQTGYMYDRVTRRLFGNKGTGSFVLGPDVAKPVMGLWGMRKFYNARDYVQDGLVAMWDGEWNAGVGVHDATATTWVNLNDNGPVLNRGSSAIAWLGDSLTITSANGNNGAFNVSSTGFATLVKTVEVIASFSASNAVQCIFNLGTGASSGVGVSTSGYMAAGGRTPFGSAGTGSSQYGCWIFNGGMNSEPVECYQNGVSSGLGTSVNIGVGNNYLTNKLQIGSLYLARNAFTGKIHAIRLYSRALSPTEIAHNYAIDKARFNLP